MLDQSSLFCSELIPLVYYHIPLPPVKGWCKMGVNTKNETEYEVDSGKWLKVFSTWWSNLRYYNY